ncbi:variant erythrocyte surface antigen-1 family protein [Babesia caballi]|uniref:Variant erythrocyte surface antigen-1 family protein n=1 Tax=Babesia caballi TaxID=5871 RepID=A0AAV4LN10_BABCB|nr:variant erythrocyte surface antigen-1 family protein [Babesia caballi]
MARDELLKEPPENLKDAIDWILWFCHYGRGSRDMKKQLGSAVSNLTNFTVTFKVVFGQVNEPEGLINKLGQGLAGFLGYSGTSIIGDEGIAQSDYQSTYIDADWDGVNDSTVLATNFLGAATIIFLGVTFIYWKCKISYGGWGSYRLNVGGSRDPLNLFMSTVGFKPRNELQNKSGSEVVNRMTHEIHGFSELKIVGRTGNSYSDFLKKLEERGPAQGINCPLTNCFILAKGYFTSKFTKSQGTDIEESLSRIKAALESFSTSCRFSAFDLYERIGSYVRIAMTSPPSVPANTQTNPSSSPAGAVAGTLTTFGLGGGAGAAYIFNLGGAKTIVNGLLRIG